MIVSLIDEIITIKDVSYYCIGVFSGRELHMTYVPDINGMDASAMPYPNIDASKKKTDPSKNSTATPTQTDKSMAPIDKQVNNHAMDQFATLSKLSCFSEREWVNVVAQNAHYYKKYIEVEKKALDRQLTREKQESKDQEKRAKEKMRQSFQEKIREIRGCSSGPVDESISSE